MEAEDGEGEFFDKLLKPTIIQISKGLDSDIILYSGFISEPHDHELISQCEKTCYNNAILLLSTFGGDANAAYRIARCLQRKYENFSILVSTFCKSAGTLLALGADEIIMSDFAEMGPIDVQLLKVDEVGERSSGLTLTQALSFLQAQAYDMFERFFYDLRFKSGLQISTKSASEIATSITTGLFGPVYSQIDPSRLGEIDRAVRIAIEYGNRIGQKNLKDMAIEKLVAGYPSHEFVIDRTEARELFNNVRKPTQQEVELINCLEHVMTHYIGKEKPLVTNLTKECIDKKEGGSQNVSPNGSNEKSEGGSTGEQEVLCKSVETDGQATSKKIFTDEIPTAKARKPRGAKTRTE